MKKILQMLFAGMCSLHLSAQGTFQMTPGTNLITINGAYLVLDNTHLINNGTLEQSSNSGTIKFTGAANVNLAGSGTTIIDQLQLSKGTNAVLTLQNNITILKEINFGSGLINLNNSTVNLGNTGILTNESESSRAFTSGNGYVQASANLSSPSAANPGNLGAVISSPANLGNTIVQRGHTAQNNAIGMAGSILRYYLIAPTNNTNIEATLMFRYLDAELNNVNENFLRLYKSTDNINWTVQGNSTIDVNNNFVQKTGITDFSIWTLSGASDALPVSFLLFNSLCKNEKVSLTWKTAQEFNSRSFEVQRSSDGRTWQAIGTVSAAGISSTEKTYSYTDDGGSTALLYRIAQYDADGKMNVSTVIKPSCATLESFSVYPNPVIDKTIITIKATEPARLKLLLYDNKGSLIRVMQTTLLQGNNQLEMNVTGLAKGTYILTANWNNTIKVSKIEKQ